MAHLIGIDVGTSGAKTLIINEKGKVLASKTVEYDLKIPQPGWAEQDPEEWWKAVASSCRAVMRDSGAKPDSVAGISFSGQMHGSVFLDEKGKVVRPCILWCDNRTIEECAEITETVGAKQLHRWVSNPALTGFTLPKLLWLKNKEPKQFARTRHLLLPKDYIAWRMTGELATDISDAAGTIMLDIKKRKWCEPLLEKLEIPREWLPKIYNSYEPVGKLTRKAASECGLREGIPVMAGAADNPAGAVGTGMVVEGRVSVSLGTSGVVFTTADSVKVDPEERLHTFCHATENQWCVFGCMLAAGLSLQWYRNQMAKDEWKAAKKSGQDIYDILMNRAEKSAPGADGLYFMPYLMGERSPHKDPLARGAFVGLTFGHTENDIIRSIVEGISFGIRDSVEIMKEMDLPATEVRMLGGGAKNKFWRRIMADVLNTEIAILKNAEGPAMGAAILAGVGAGIFRDFKETTDNLLPVATRIEPDKDNAARYDAHYRTWRQLYPALKEWYPVREKTLAHG